MPVIPRPHALVSNRTHTAHPQQRADEHAKTRRPGAMAGVFDGPHYRSLSVWLPWCTVRCALFGTAVHHRHTERERPFNPPITTHLHAGPHPFNHPSRPRRDGSYCCDACMHLGTDDPH
jgi:hypothetical protein